MDNLKKDPLLQFFRDKSNEFLSNIKSETIDYKKQATKINKNIQNLRDDLLKITLEKKLSESEQLNNILLIKYVTDVVMLESRNKVWGYDYMSFSRRIGEIWEPFSKTPFYYPINHLSLYKPPKFVQVKNNLKKEIQEYINELIINDNEKKELIEYFKSVWAIVESGEIKLDLDLHFIQNNICYNIDYKSGFSSNEKGNVNRLLLVGSIYHTFPSKHKNIMFVRQAEEENNHYLQTLKNSPYWEVYCAKEVYEKIEEFTGFSLRGWINENINWQQDITVEFKDYLRKNDLLKYLTW